MCKSRLEFQYCCILISLFFFMGLYQFYDSISSSNVILHIQSEMKFRITTDILNPSTDDELHTDNLTVLIGLTPYNCGSNHIANLLENIMDELQYKYIQRDRLRYWDRCMLPYYQYFDNTANTLVPVSQINDQSGCNYHHYLTKFADSLSDKLDTTQNMYYFFERTPGYIRYYHSCYLLAHYAASYRLYFYISLRNPTHRTWYEYAMYFNTKPLLHHDGSGVHRAATLNKMNSTIHHDLDQFADHYPKYQKLMDYIRIDRGQTGRHIDAKMVVSNMDLNESEIVNLWIDASYDFQQAIKNTIEGRQSAFNVPPIASSCYYPQLVMWYETFKAQNVDLSDKFKIFQFESMKDSGPLIVKELIKWINHREFSKKDQRKMVKTHIKEHFNDEEYGEELTPFITDTLKRRLDGFYTDCNLRLDWFIQRHPDLLLLPDHVFEF